MEQEEIDQERKETKKPRSLGKYLFVYAFALLIILLAVIGLQKAADRRIEVDACRKLRSFGAAELSYLDSNINHRYGSYHALQVSGDMPENETLRNIIPQYLVTWITPDYARFDREMPLWESMGEGFNTFTIIAYPHNPASLHTFAVTEEQVIREFSPEKGDKPDAARWWTPTLIKFD